MTEKSFFLHIHYLKQTMQDNPKNIILYSITVMNMSTSITLLHVTSSQTTFIATEKSKLGVGVLFLVVVGGVDCDGFFPFSRVAFSL